MNNLTGTIKVIFDKQVASERFSKREFVLTTQEETPYPQHVSIEAQNDKIALLDQLQVGDRVSCDVLINGREWNGPQGVKYFNTIILWKTNKAV